MIIRKLLATKYIPSYSKQLIRRYARNIVMWDADQ